MDERKKQILQAVIRDYVDVGEPVGSRTIAKKYDLGVSPATIRNEMSDLEEMGFICQPHTSAGRIPSDKGYRYYVDHLIEPEEKLLSDEEQQAVGEFFASCEAEAEQLFQQSCRLLSRMTNYTTMLMRTKAPGTVLERLKLVRLQENQFLVILITDDGKIHNKVLNLAVDFSDAELAEAERILQDRLLGRSLSEVGGALLSEITRHLLQQQSALRQALAMLQDLVLDSRANHKNDLLIQGTLNLLKQPEFQDVDTVRELFSALEANEVVKDLLLLASQQRQGTVVYIGNELNRQGMSACSMVTAPYYVNGEMIGRIGVLGPTRMPYPKVIALVEQVSREVGNKIEGGTSKRQG